MGVLISTLFTEGDQATVNKLENCATGRPSEVLSHISKGQNRSGEHVRRVQQALQKIQSNEPGLDIPAFEVNGVYDPAFATAVAAYKEKRNIRNFANKIDDVVGIKTIKSLDQDVAAIEGKGRKVLPIKILKTQEIYVKIFGFNNASQQAKDVSSRQDAQDFAKSINQSAGYLEDHLPLETVWFIGGVNPSPVTEIVGRVISLAVRSPRPQDGRIFVSGGSSGGKNAFQVAERLGRANLSIAFIGLWDAAWNREELIDPSQFDRDENFDPNNPATLKFKGLNPDINCEKINFFQSYGHTLNKGLEARRGQEIHGDVKGFRPRDLTRSPQVLAVKARFDSQIIKLGRDRQKAIDDSHTAAFLIGRDESEQRVRKMLTG